MAVTIESYFAALRDYLNTNDYEVTDIDGDRVIISDEVYWPGSTTPTVQNVSLAVPGEAIVINLDTKFKDGKRSEDRKGASLPFFHFLKDESKPWAKRCDFVIFHLYRNQIRALCIEFKSASFPESLPDQMNAGAAWCRSLHSVIRHYTGKTKRLRITKYVLSCHETPERFLDRDGKYLKKDHTVRHYHYRDIDGLSLADLENRHVDSVG